MPIPKKLPTKPVLRSRLLERIRAARFPNDVGSFTLIELQQNGFCEKYPKKDGISEGLYKTLVLLANQAEDFRKERDRLKDELEQLRPYRSPLILEAMEQIDPLEQERLLALARADEIKVANRRAARKEVEAAEIHQIFTLLSKKGWKTRDRRSRPHGARLWHDPMTCADYHHATGLSRKTIQNMLTRLKALPFTKRTRKNEPLRYGPDVNLAVLRDWLMKSLKQKDHRRVWLALTLLKYRHEASDKIESVVKALWPVFKSLGADTVASIEEFRIYMNKCDQVLYPPPPPPLQAGISELLGSYLSSVGKNG